MLHNSNSTSNSISTSSSTSRSPLSSSVLLRHPLYSPTLLCIGAAAEVVLRGGNRTEILSLFPESQTEFIANSLANATSTYVSSCPSVTDSVAVLPPDAYLCTGLDLYLYQEPDLMSCMALIHSRIRRVFFLHADVSRGALLSHVHLHTLPIN